MAERHSCHSMGWKVGSQPLVVVDYQAGCLVVVSLRREGRRAASLSGNDYGRGTIEVNGATYAWSRVIRPTTQARKRLCQNTALKMSASLPS